MGVSDPIQGARHFERKMQDTPDRLEPASGDAQLLTEDGASRRELLEKIERFAYVAPALALLVAPAAAVAYGGGKGRGGGKGPGGGKGGGRGKGGGGKGGAGKGGGKPKVGGKGGRI
jgi:hypothetical protein